MAKRPRRLVIDADVAKSAGESEHLTSRACRKFLEAVLNVGHRVVMTDAIREEWHRHMSPYSRKWQTRMWGRRRVDFIEGERDEQLRQRIDGAVTRDQKAIVAKDIHLIEAAIATDRLITSRDKRARRAFGDAADAMSELRRVVWVDPTCDGEKPIDWLQNGAQAEARRRLGS